MLVLRLALREIRNHARFGAFFALNLALGLTGFLLLDAFEGSVARALQARSKAFLGGDVELAADRPFAGDEILRFDRIVGADARSAEITDLFSMAGGEGIARLVELRAIDEAFPLHGAVVLEDVGPAGPAEHAALARAPGVWVDPPLLARLGLSPGGVLRLGNSDFAIQGVVARDGGRATSGFSIAPRVYIARARLEGTGLVSTGSRVRHRRLYALAADADAAAVAAEIRETLVDPRLSVRSHTEATQALARTFGAVSDYLGLVSLVAAFLAGLGASHLFRAFLARRVREVAILLSLGATRSSAQGVYAVQLLLLAAAATAIATATAAVLLPVAASAAAAWLPHGFSPRIDGRAVAAAAVLALAGSTAACLPLLARLRSLRPAELFAEQAQPALGRGPADLWLLLPAFALFWGVSVWRVGDLQAGSWFAGLFGASVVLVLLLALVALRVLARLPLRGLAARLALRELARNRASSVSGFTAIALCALLVSLAPQLRAVLEGDLEMPGDEALPSLFLFDVQPEQVERLGAIVAERGTELTRLSPLVRARLDAINGADVRTTQGAPPPAARGARSADEERRRLRSRQYNLSYREHLTASETLTSGRPFNGRHDPGSGALPEMSLERDFARRLGVGVGDALRFDVQGVPVEARIVNLREVRWNSFQPNFFVTLQPGVLEEAPRIFIGSVPQLPEARREALQAAIVEALPNVSVVDVTRQLERLLGLVDQLQWALASTASLSLVVGLLLVFAIARDRAHARRWETNLLKVLGADFRRIRSALDLEFGLLALAATLTGCALSLIASGVLAHALLEAPWTIAWAPLAITVVGIPLVCVASGRAAARQVLRERPLALLQAAGA